MTHPHEERIQDYLDDLLCREERAELEAHFASCAQCTAQVRAERELQRALRTLPTEITAPAGMLEGIHARISAGPQPVAPVRSRVLDRPLRSVRPALAAAAVVLVALSSGVTALWLRRAESTPPEAAAAVPAGAAILAVEQPYQRQEAELRATLDAGRAVLAPETVRILEDNLAVIDAALAEARAVLREDPGNGAVLALLRATHERRIDLLRQATRWSAGT